MKKISFCILILLLVSNIVSAQKCGLNFGYGFYNMGTVKELRNYINMIVPVPLSNTDNFPPYVYYGGGFEYDLNKTFKTGLGYSYYTTGARSMTKDYSGSYIADYVLVGHAIKLPITISIFRDFYHVNIGFSNDFELIFSSLKISENIQVWDEKVSDKKRFYGNNICFEPGIYIEKKISKLYFRFKTGYNIALLGNLHQKDEKEVKLLLPDQSIVNTNWSGLRFNFSVYYELGEKQ
jgi:hypothetical protein